MPGRKPITIGERFGRLLVVENGFKIDTRYAVRCVCDCGAEKAFSENLLRAGKVNSCGCLRSEMVTAKNTSHGMRHTPEWMIWSSMVSRCHNSNDTGYGYYGKRGITVCDRWRTSSGSFFADMGPRPSPKHTLDRIDNDGNYEPGNCRWATRKEQARNRRSNTNIVFDGRSQCIADWAEELRLSPRALSRRLRAGWSVKRALMAPRKSPKVSIL